MTKRDTFKKQQVFYFLIFIIFISYLSIYTFQNNSQKTTDCEQYLVSYSENINIEEYLEKNPMSIRDNIALIELNLLPDLNSVKCLGKQIEYTPVKFDVDKTIATSHRLLILVNFLNVTTIYSLFLLFSKNSKFQFSLIILISYFLFSNLFFGGLMFNYYLLIYPLSIFVYALLNYSHDRKNKFLDIFIFINVNLLIFNYDLYSLLLPFFIIFYFFFLKQHLMNHQIKILSFGAIFYYFLRQLSGPLDELTYIWQNLSSSMFRGTPRFADMYYTFAVLDCNKTGCGFENNYGPLWEYLAINININVASYVSSIILIFITQVFFYNLMMKSLAKGMLIFFVYISPPTAFLFERMNFDVIVAIFGYYAIKKYSEGKRSSSLIILTILTLVKIFPIVLLLGIAIYEYINKNNSNSLQVILLMFGNILIYLIYFFWDLQSGSIANPTGISWTFGIPTDMSNYLEFFGNFGLLLYLITLIICIYLYFKYLKINNTIKIFSSEDWLLEFSFLICFVFISMYYNFDFRISIFSVGLILLIKNYNLQKFEIISILFLSTSVSNFYTIELLTTDPLIFYFSTLILLVNQITFNLVFIFLFFEILYFLINKQVFYFYKDFKKISKS